jgi:hypothetical protein
VHALFKFGKLSQHAAIGEQPTSTEIPTGVLFKQRACRVAQVRLMHGNQFRFNLRFARKKSITLRKQVINTKPVAHEISARCLALHHNGAWRTQRVTCAFGGKDVGMRGRVRAEAPVMFRPPGGVHAKACDRAGHFVRHGAASHGDQPR